MRRRATRRGKEVGLELVAPRAGGRVGAGDIRQRPGRRRSAPSLPAKLGRLGRSLPRLQCRREALFIVFLFGGGAIHEGSSGSGAAVGGTTGFQTTPFTENRCNRRRFIITDPFVALGLGGLSRPRWPITASRRAQKKVHNGENGHIVTLEGE